MIENEKWNTIKYLLKIYPGKYQLLKTEVPGGVLYKLFYQGEFVDNCLLLYPIDQTEEYGDHDEVCG